MALGKRQFPCICNLLIASQTVANNTLRVDSLREYRRKRPAGKSPEPRGGTLAGARNTFVVQRHDATRLHYDFRLEMDGVLKSWAVPKGPSLDPGVKRLAVQVEDHPLDYGGFEGTIPEGNYGAGEVILWDKGTYSLEGKASGKEQLERGEIKFVLNGHKLRGSFVLVKLRNHKYTNSSSKSEWLLIKHRDSEVQTDWNIEDHNRSVKSGNTPGPPRHGKTAAKQLSNLASGAQRLTNAKKAPLPDSLSPGLAQLSDRPFSSKDWLFEIKWDGMRSLVWIEDGKTKLVSRSGRNVTAEFPEFRDLAKQVRVPQAVLDGEIVVLDKDGRSNFQRIQSRFGVANPPVELQETSPATLYLFDILYCDGYDVRRAPLLERKELLSRILTTSESVRVSEHQVESGEELFQAAVSNGLEGIVAKRVDSPYPTGRTSNWLKFKTTKEIEAVVGGWTDPQGSRQYFGSLLVGLYKDKTLQFIGGVGTGFPNKLEKDIYQKLNSIASDKCPFVPQPRTREKSHWVAPELVARVGFAEWTSDQHLRQPRFLGLQSDRSPIESTFEKETKSVAAPASMKKPAKKKLQKTIKKPGKTKSENSGEGATSILNKIRTGEEVRLQIDTREVKLTHLSKIYFPKSAISKRDVLSYYATVSPFILPFLKDRPLVLHRYPNGISKPSFYQKEAGDSIPDWIRTVDIFSESKNQDVTYFIINDLASLLYLTNLGCIEHNPFSARADDLEKPDYMFIDLDPTEGAPFSRVVSAAKVICETLDNAHLRYFVKTSGATGMHIFIPVERRYTFEHVRGFLEIVTQLAAEKDPGLLTRTFKVKDRPKQSVFVDIRQNSFAQSLACVFSLRPHEQAPVSTPVAVAELEKSLKPSLWNLNTVVDDLKARAKLWADFWAKPQTLERAVTALEHSQSKASARK
jgi:bifunctional non-homologous end joining protein LigD